MGRIRQLNPGNYASSGNVDAEFENLIRYLLTAERGQKTLGEMIGYIFDEDGDIASGLVEMRNDSDNGIQFRVGNYSSSETEVGWQTVVSLASLRGEAGANLGSVVLPIFTGRIDYTGDNVETTFAFVFTNADEVLVFKNGVLQRKGALYDYTLGTNEVIFTSAPALDDDITFFKIRDDASIQSTRVDQVPVGTQSVFSYIVPTGSYELYVYKNGILQREGGSYDFTLNVGNNTITFTTPITTSDTVTFLTVESNSATAVTGLMTESNYVNPATGKIMFSKIGIADGEITQAKVASLVSELALRAKFTISASAPTGIATGHFWQDTSVSPNVLRFYDGVNWLATSPDNDIPAYDADDAGYYLRVNGSGTALEFQTVDLSGLITTSQKGAASGVASLDINGLIPENQMPEVRGTNNFYYYQSGSITNGDYTIHRFYKTRLRIVGLTGVLTAGSCTIQLKINGSLVGGTYNLSTSPLDQTISPQIEVNALTASKPVQITVTGASSADGATVSLAYEILE